MPFKIPKAAKETEPGSQTSHQQLHLSLTPSPSFTWSLLPCEAAGEDSQVRGREDTSLRGQGSVPYSALGVSFTPVSSPESAPGWRMLYFPSGNVGAAPGSVLGALRSRL